jgi:hypothetical protein
MHLKLSLGGAVIASVPLNEKEVGSLEYVYAKRNLLTEACSLAIALQKESPVYFIEVGSKMNTLIEE